MNKDITNSKKGLAAKILAHGYTAAVECFSSSSEFRSFEHEQRQNTTKYMTNRDKHATTQASLILHGTEDGSITEQYNRRRAEKKTTKIYME